MTSEDQIKLLESYYFNKKTGFISAPRLHKKIREDGHKITLKQVTEYIKGLEVNEVFEKADKTNVNFPITSESSNDYQSDLAFLETYKTKIKDIIFY